MLYAVLLIVTGLMGLGMQTLKKQEWTEKNNLVKRSALIGKIFIWQ